MKNIYGANRVGFFVGLFLVFLSHRISFAELGEVGKSAFDIPRLNQISIDGNPADWGDRGLQINALHGLPPRSEDADDFDATVRLGWDDRGLLVLVETFESPVQDGEGEVAFQPRDSVDIFLADAVGGNQMWQVAMSQGRNPESHSIRTNVTDHRSATAKKAPKPKIKVAGGKTPTGQVFEALLPWEILSTAPASGSELAFQIYVNRIGEDDEPNHRLTWYPRVGAADDSTLMQRIRLAENPGSAITAAATGEYEGMRRVRVRVATSDVGGEKTAQIRLDPNSVFQIPLAKTARLLSGETTLPMPALGKTYGPLGVWHDGKQIDTIELPDANRLRIYAINHVDFGFDSYVFSGRRFPKAQFKDPFYAEDLIGPFSLHTTYYDKDYKPVATPSEPGRYGAVVEIRAESGFSTKRFFTLYHQPQDLQWRKVETPLDFQLPPEMGIDPEVAGEESAALSDYLKNQFVQSFERGESANLLAWLSEIPAGTGALPQRLGPATSNAAWIYGLKKKRGDLKPYQYLLHLPAGVATGSSQRFPLILFLHGIGERGDDLQKVSHIGLAGKIRHEPDWPFIDQFIVVSPQCSGGWWESLLLRDVLDEVVAKYPVDPDRIYVTGLSMGGYGTWALAQEFSDRFAAVAPICGDGDATDVVRLKDLPIWAFHGALDSTVPIEGDYKMIKALRDIHGRVRFTVYPNVGHIAWEPAYADDRLYDWFLQQRRGHPVQEPSTLSTTQPSED